MQTLEMEEAVTRLLTALKGDSPRTLIGLAGQPGSGKSTAAARLAVQVNAAAGPEAMIALSMDGFHLTKAQLRALPDPEAALERRGAPWTFDPAALAARLHAVRESAGRRDVPWPEFEHGVGDPVEDTQIVNAQTRLVMIEGLYLLHPADGWAEVRRCFDGYWYLNTPIDTARERLARRHMFAWGLTRPEADARIALNDGLNAEIVAHSREFADFLLNE